MDFLTVQAIRKTWTCLPFFFIFLLLMRVVSAFFRCCFSAFYCFMDLRLWFVVDKLVVDKWRVKRWCCWGCGVVDILGEGGERAQNGEKIRILCPLFFFVFSVVEVSLRRFLLRQCIFATIVGYCYGRCGSFLFLVVINC